MTFAESTTIDDETFWACGRAMGGYPGSFPNGFLQRVELKFGISDKRVLFPYGGAMPTQFDGDVGDEWVVNDIKPDLGHTTHDATEPPAEWHDSFEVVLADPPYGQFKANELYDTEHPGYKNICLSAARCVEVGGLLLILDHLVYTNYMDSDRYDYDISFDRKQPIAVTCGPNQRIRVLNIFERTG